jgi:hypothetical protein
MSFINKLSIPVDAPPSGLWKYVRAYDKVHEYVDFITSTTMEDENKFEPAIGVKRVVTNTEGKKLDENITAWDEKNKSYTFDIQNGPPFAKAIFFTLSVKDNVDNKSKSELECVVNLELKGIFYYILPSFLLKKKIGGKQAELMAGYKNAAEKKLQDD